jgi:endonuclease/exonuclease/phosphatase family metal-dependent hydrolase
MKEIFSGESFMFYNVENFFLPNILKSPHELQTTLWNWDSTKYRRKIQNLAKVFGWVNESYHRLPILCGLAEVECDAVLNDLVAEPIFQNKFDFIHYDSLDERGVDVALLYNKHEIELIESRIMRYTFDDADRRDTTRDVLCAKFEYHQQALYVYVMHLPSKLDHNINQHKRKYILEQVNLDIQKKLQQNPQAKILVMGDMNQNPNEEDLTHFAYQNGEQKILHNPFKLLYQNKKFSNVHNGVGHLFDQIMISENWYQSYDKHHKPQANIFYKPSMVIKQKNHEIPFRTYVGTRYVGGYSDHLPVLMHFNTPKKPQ